MRLKESRKQADKSSMNQSDKFKKWGDDNFSLISDLVLSVMHPITIPRTKTHVAFIQLKELPIGFRVLSAEAVAFEIASLPTSKSNVRECLRTLQSENPDNVNCVAVFDAENIEATGACTYLEGYGVGYSSMMNSIQQKSSYLNDGRTELLNKLNKEMI
jgi:hypothetical protein